MIYYLLRYYFNVQGGHAWHSGSALDYWSAGGGFDPVPGALFITKFTPFAQVVRGPV